MGPSIKLCPSQVVVYVNRVVLESHERFDNFFPMFEGKLQVGLGHVGQFVVVVVEISQDGYDGRFNDSVRDILYREVFYCIWLNASPILKGIYAQIVVGKAVNR